MEFTPKEIEILQKALGQLQKSETKVSPWDSPAEEQLISDITSAFDKAIGGVIDDIRNHLTDV